MKRIFVLVLCLSCFQLNAEFRRIPINPNNRIIQNIEDVEKSKKLNSIIEEVRNSQNCCTNKIDYKSIVKIKDKSVVVELKKAVYDLSESSKNKFYNATCNPSDSIFEYIEFYKCIINDYHLELNGEASVKNLIQIVQRYEDGVKLKKEKEILERKIKSISFIAFLGVLLIYSIYKFKSYIEISKLLLWNKIIEYLKILDKHIKNNKLFNRWVLLSTILVWSFYQFVLFVRAFYKDFGRENYRVDEFLLYGIFPIVLWVIFYKLIKRN